MEYSRSCGRQTRCLIHPASSREPLFIAVNRGPEVRHDAADATALAGQDHMQFAHAYFAHMWGA
jgi:hypothetical protein